MKTLFSTAEVHPRDRFDLWHDTACKNLVAHESTPESRLAFRAELQAGALADVGVILFENTPMRIRHTARHIACTEGGEQFFVCRQIAGELALEQSGREVVMKAGEMTLLDPRMPYAGKFSGASRLLVLKVPRRALEARIGRGTEMVARSITPSEGTTSLASAFLAMLPTYTGVLDARAEEIAKDQALDLVGVSLGKMMEKLTCVSSARALTLMNVRAAVESRLSDPALDSASVAAAARTSVRYANAVLSGEGMSIMRLIQARRLARCRSALEDPSQAHRTISEIAYGWGFSDMTHFGRKFRAVYGLMPSEWRRRATKAE